jgi:precorrin-2 methylase
MIAALLLIVAGVTVVSEMNSRADNPLAKRAESIEELSVPYAPEENFTPVEYYEAIPDGKAGRILIVRDGSYRDVTVAPQYRRQS